MTGFWVFMLIMALVIPLSMVGFGSCFCKKTPSRINAVFGYRTERSMKNRDTWQFAHAYYGRLSRKMGWYMVIGTIVTMLLIIRTDVDVIGKTGSVLCIIQTLVIIASIIPTERALRRTFTEKGERKNA